MSLVNLRSLWAGRRPATLLIGAAIASAAVLLMLTADTARAAFPGPPGPIVYPRLRVATAFPTHLSNLWTQDPQSGSGPGRLASSFERLMNPSFSRSGEWITYVENHEFSDGLSQILRIRNNHTDQTRVTDGTHIDSNPSYFPGGGRIVFDRLADDGFFHIFAISLDAGEPPEQLTFGDHNDTDPVVNPRRARIAFVTDRNPNSARDHSDIWVMRTDGSLQRALINGRRSSEWAPDYAPNGRRIAFNSNRGRGRANVFVAKASGRRVRRVTHSRYDCFRGPCYERPAFSPSGRWITMLGMSRYSTEVAIVRRNGRRLHTFVSAGTDDQGYGTTLGAPTWGRIPH